MNDQTPPANRADINRANSLKSTGPKTEAGKKRSSLNAFRHGLTGQVIVMPEEDLAAYERVVKRFHDDRQPKGVIETDLTQQLAEDSWCLHRARMIENNWLSLAPPPRIKSTPRIPKPMPLSSWPSPQR